MADGSRTSAPFSDRDMKLLTVFRAVAEAGGLTAAERRLGVERSTISRQVKLLEERLGGVLCQRGPRGFELTELGRAALAAAGDLEDALALARGRIEAARGVVTGELRLGVADNCLSNPDARIVETLEAFAAAAPDVELTVIVDAPSRLNRALLARELHAAIDGVEPDQARLTAIPLFREEFRLFVAVEPGQPAPRLSDLGERGYRAVMRRAEQSPAARALKRLSLVGQADASGLEAVATLVATGCFVGLLPIHMLRGFAISRRFVEVEDAEDFVFQSELMLLTEMRRPVTPALTTLGQIAIAAHLRPMDEQSAGNTKNRTLSGNIKSS
jgi:DNA-binding transcriptional LysR family regulator